MIAIWKANLQFKQARKLTNMLFFILESVKYILYALYVPSMTGAERTSARTSERVNASESEMERDDGGRGGCCCRHQRLQQQQQHQHH